MNINQRHGRRLRSNAGRTEKTRVAYMPTATGPEETPLHCFAMGSLRSRR